MAGVILEEVFQPLLDLDYPASKQDVVRHAETRGASEEVLRTLRALPLGDYASRRQLAVRWTRPRAAPVDVSA